MSIEKIKTLRTIRGRDITLRYTQDNLVESLITQRQFYDQDGNILAPITPKLLERQIEINSTLLKLGGIEPRTATACFGSTVNASGESNFVVIIPYAPGDNHNEHLREIFAFISPSSNVNPSSALNVNYRGENLT